MEDKHLERLDKVKIYLRLAAAEMTSHEGAEINVEKFMQIAEDVASRWNLIMRINPQI